MPGVIERNLDFLHQGHDRVHEQTEADGTERDGAVAPLARPYLRVLDGTALSITFDRITGEAELVFDAAEGARAAYESFPPSTKKQILWWVKSAVRPATRARRIAQTVEAAARGERIL